MTNINQRAPRAVIGTPWFIRKAIYLVVTVVGLVAVVLGWVTPGDVDMWLSQAGSLAAVVGGGMAAVSTGRASDKSPAEEIADNAAATAPAYVSPQPQRVGETYQDIRERVAIHNAE